jgi:hypothetical protein
MPNLPEKDFPSFREEDQDMAHALEPVIIGPPAYASPDPDTNANTLVPVDEHPAELPEDYGESAPKTVDITMNSDATPQGEGGPLALGSDEDREEWTKEQWQEKAEGYGLAKSGNKDEIRDRVEEFESDPSNFEDDNPDEEE